MSADVLIVLFVGPPFAGLLVLANWWLYLEIRKEREP